MEKTHNYICTLPLIAYSGDIHVSAPVLCDKQCLFIGLTYIGMLHCYAEGYPNDNQSGYQSIDFIIAA